jgi:hypothetical protein
MSNTLTGADARGADLKTKTETVYGGPGLQPGAPGTVYNGPGTGAPYSPAPPNSTTRSVQPSAITGSKAGGVFFLIAGFSAINTLLILGKAPFVLAIGLAMTRVQAQGDVVPVLILNAIAIGVFVMLGVFAAKGSKAAFLIGLLLYGGDMALLLFSSNAALHLPSIVVHGIFMFSIFKGFRQLS